MSSATIMMNQNKKQLDKMMYEQRKSQITAIKGRISGATEGNISNINKKINDLAEKLEISVKGISDLQSLIDQFEDKRERSSASDQELDSYANNLDLEIEDCTAKINDLESEISSLKAQYQTALHDEQEAARKALENTLQLVTG